MQPFFSTFAPTTVVQSNLGYEEHLHWSPCICFCSPQSILCIKIQRCPLKIIVRKYHFSAQSPPKLLSWNKLKALTNAYMVMHGVALTLTSHLTHTTSHLLCKDHTGLPVLPEMPRRVLPEIFALAVPSDQRNHVSHGSVFTQVPVPPRALVTTLSEMHYSV